MRLGEVDVGVQSVISRNQPKAIGRYFTAIKIVGGISAEFAKAAALSTASKIVGRRNVKALNTTRRLKFERYRDDHTLNGEP